MDTEYKENFREAFDAFMSESFRKSVLASTRASWSKNSCSVELYADGTYRAPWIPCVVNHLDTHELMLRVPPLGDEDWNMENPNDSCFTKAEEILRDEFEDVLCPSPVAP